MVFPCIFLYHSFGSEANTAFTSLCCFAEWLAASASWPSRWEPCFGRHHSSGTWRCSQQCQHCSAPFPHRWMVWPCDHRPQLPASRLLGWRPYHNGEPYFLSQQLCSSQLIPLFSQREDRILVNLALVCENYQQAEWIQQHRSASYTIHLGDTNFADSNRVIHCNHNIGGLMLDFMCGSQKPTCQSDVCDFAGSIWEEFAGHNIFLDICGLGPWFPGQRLGPAFRHFCPAVSTGP